MNQLILADQFSEQVVQLQKTYLLLVQEKEQILSRKEVVRLFSNDLLYGLNYTGTIRMFSIKPSIVKRL